MRSTVSILRASKPFEDPIDCLPADDLFALRSRVHVAMNAGEIAKFAEVELKDLRASTRERQAVIGQCPRKGSLRRPVRFLGSVTTPGDR